MQESSYYYNLQRLKQQRQSELAASEDGSAVSHINFALQTLILVVSYLWGMYAWLMRLQQPRGW